MIASMTAFARHSAQTEVGRVTWELRSVNSRFLELNLRLPDEYRALEPVIRETIEKQLKRGKVDATLKLETTSASEDGIHINENLARQLVNASHKIQTLLPQAALPSTLELLRWPNIIENAAQDAETITPLVIAALSAALTILVETRRREGAKLRELLQSRLHDAAERVARVRQTLPAIVEHIKNRWLARVNEILQSPGMAENVDRGRVEQETAMLLQRLDVAEEMDRLQTHLAEVARVMENDPAPGRRLDFLMQELQREANTLGSKSAHVDSTGASVDLKVLIEQMREQIQNIE